MVLRLRLWLAEPLLYSADDTRNCSALRVSGFTRTVCRSSRFRRVDISTLSAWHSSAPQTLHPILEPATISREVCRKPKWNKYHSGPVYSPLPRRPSKCPRKLPSSEVCEISNRCRRPIAPLERLLAIGISSHR
jgi:hypothetical protein